MKAARCLSSGRSFLGCGFSAGFGRGGVVCAAEKGIRRRIVYVRQGNQQVGRQVPIPPFIAEILRLGAAKTCGKLSLREIMDLSKFPDSPRIGHGKIPPAPRLDVKRKAEKCGKTYFIVAAILVIAALFGGCGGQSERNRIGASIDWGDGFYWNSSSESVERPLFLRGQC